ncbi:MAG: Uma2 family endonuclease [Cyanobacteria bacterium P01_A01_bin.123]
MADNTRQFRWIVTIKENLELLFADRDGVFVAGDLLWYPVEGNNLIRQAPDVMVVVGCPKGDRGSYQQWKENNLTPQVVFEILSPGNRLKEMTKKFKFYDRYGVEEYYLYDPESLDLAGWLRTEGEFEPIEEMQGWVSPRLGIRFRLTSVDLELYQPNGDRFLTFVELAQQRTQEQQQRVAVEQKLSETESLLARYREKFGDL